MVMRCFSFTCMLNIIHPGQVCQRAALQRFPQLLVFLFKLSFLMSCSQTHRHLLPKRIQFLFFFFLIRPCCVIIFLTTLV